MPSIRSRYTRIACALTVAVLICAAAAWRMTLSPTAHAATTGALQQQISQGQSRISTLSGALQTTSSRLTQLNHGIGSLQRRIALIQTDLDVKRAELLKLRDQLTAARLRLTHLEAFEAHAESVLRAQLVGDYESDRPDVVSVVLEASGFQDLLERLSFMQRISNQNAQVISHVRAARTAVAAQATQLGALEQRQQTLTTRVLRQRNALAAVRVDLVQQQIVVAAHRTATASRLASARTSVGVLQRQLSRLEAAQAAATAAQGQAPGSGSGSGATGGSAGGGQVSSGGGFTFPLPKGSASPPGTWSPDQGVDISAPGGTPEYAVCSGTIVLHGIGGFGPWAPVLHCDSPLAGYSYVYYGHAGPANQLPIGTHVAAGQVISEVGPGIVGISTGPHIEIGFADSSGSPIGSGSAATMLSLLHGAYGG
jgi:murein DD-endopeptidase MepM/ murein hydrolase activator NlpD